MKERQKIPKIVRRTNLIFIAISAWITRVPLYINKCINNGIFRLKGAKSKQNHNCDDYVIYLLRII